MAARLSKDERLPRLVDDCREKVGPRDAATPISLSQAPKRHLKSLVKDAGYQRIATQFLNLLDRRLKDAGIGTYPELLDPTITRDTCIYLFDLDHPIPGLQSRRVLFSEEQQLSDFLVKNFNALTYVKRAGLHFRGRDVRLAGEASSTFSRRTRSAASWSGSNLRPKKVVTV